MIDPLDIVNLNNLMIKNNSEIGTLATKISDSILKNENIVKVTTKERLKTENCRGFKFFRKKH